MPELSKIIEELSAKHENATVPHAIPSVTSSRHVETRVRAIVWREDEKGNDFAAFIGPNAAADFDCYLAMMTHLPLLLTSLSELEALRKRSEGMEKALKEIADKERERMYGGCPDCDHPHKCTPTRTCTVRSQSQEIALRVLAALTTSERGGT